MSPIISIIIPTYNRANIIEETLNSVLSQTYKNWECFIVDDGSTDDSIAVINAYIKKDDRVKLFIRPDSRIKGASTCRNIGLENANGDYIQFLDSDDLISKNKIATQVKLIKDENSNCIVTCKWGRFKKNESDADVYEGFDSYQNFDNMELFLNSLITSRGYFPLHTYLIKHSLIKKTGYWNEKLTLNDDGEFMMRVISNTDKIYFAKEAIAYYRWMDTVNLSSFNNKQNVNNAILSWKLIENYLKIRFKKDTIQYVETIKNGVYINVEKSFPELIFKHPDFFKKQLDRKKLVNRIKKKLKR